jgi:hypothetical protein
MLQTLLKVNSSSDFDYIARRFNKNSKSGETSIFQELESASLLVRQKMFDKLVEIKGEKDLMTGYLKYDLAEKFTKCLDGK